MRQLAYCIEITLYIWWSIGKVHLCPVPWHECRSPFGTRDLDRRLLLLQSGGQVDYSRLASLNELSRPTVKAHIKAMRIAHAIHLLPPFHGGGKQEIVGRPKCYAFDTGFVAYERGWEQIREEDRGLLWEHLVLDALRMQFRDDQIFYWQDKSRREIDFMIRREGGRVDLIERKANADKLDMGPVKALRRIYPNGDNYVAAPLVREPWRMRRNGMVFTLGDVPIGQLKQVESQILTSPLAEDLAPPSCATPTHG